MFIYSHFLAPLSKIIQHYYTPHYKYVAYNAYKSIPSMCKPIYPRHNTYSNTFASGATYTYKAQLGSECGCRSHKSLFLPLQKTLKNRESEYLHPWRSFLKGLLSVTWNLQNVPVYLWTGPQEHTRGSTSAISFRVQTYTGPTNNSAQLWPLKEMVKGEIWIPRLFRKIVIREQSWRSPR